MNRTLTSIIIMILSTANLNAQQSAADTENKPIDSQSVYFDFEIYAIHGNVAGETSLTEDIWTGTGLKPEFGTKKSHSIFVLADLDVGSGKLTANAETWNWPEEMPPEVELTAIPKILVTMDQTAEIAIGQGSHYQYFEKLDNGLFKLRTIESDTPGLSITLRPENNNGKYEHDPIILRDLTFKTKLITKREPIEGVELNVGRPIFQANEIATTLAVKPGQYYGIQIITEGMGAFIIKMKIDRVGIYTEQQDTANETAGRR